MKNTVRRCLTLDLKADDKLIEEYRFWHSPENIWKEIPEGIRKAGILDMEIYLLGTRLFMIVETTPEFDWEKDMKRLSEFPRQKEWEDFVSRFQASVPGQASSEKWKLMERIFKL
ncbi:MAG: L-rhamnose mutarotase [Bacteroidetes bacterium]|nr:L-rhamnose mutarotase [Bacteroidota bacterium]